MKTMLAALAALLVWAALPATAGASTTFQFSGAFDGIYSRWVGDGWDDSIFTGRQSTITATSDDAPTLVTQNGVDTYVYTFSSVSATDLFQLANYVRTSDLQLFVTPSLNQVTFTYYPPYWFVLLALTLPTSYTSGDYPAAAVSLARNSGWYTVSANDYWTVTGVSDATFSATVTQDGTGAVPESATWALFLTGFGAIGMIVRRRRGALAA